MDRSGPQRLARNAGDIRFRGKFSYLAGAASGVDPAVVRLRRDTQSLGICRVRLDRPRWMHGPRDRRFSIPGLFHPVSLSRPVRRAFGHHHSEIAVVGRN